MARINDGIISDLPEPEAVAEGATWSVTRASVIASGDRRLEAEAYLSDGYGRRLSVESRPSGWKHLGGLANVWQPARLKGVIVDPSRGVPFLSAGQVFESVPRARKWLSLSQTTGAKDCYVPRGTLLMSRSGTVGKVIVAHEPHVNVVLSDDLLRIAPRDESLLGWLYAYMRTPTFRMMATTLRYGHIVKHLEVQHLKSLPVVDVAPSVSMRMTTITNEIFSSRDKAQQLIGQAERIYFNALGGYLPKQRYDDPMLVSSSRVTKGRRRLDGFYHNQDAVDIEAAIESAASSTESLAEVCTRIFYPSRFRRFFGPNGVPYRSAEELFDLNAPVTKRIYASLVEDAEKYILHAGWLVMACSGQVYGLNGSVMLLDSRHEGVFATHDLIRIIPSREKVRSGYLLLVLGNRRLGRPQVIRNAYGTSIPHLDVADIEHIRIPRLADALEAEISDLMLEAVRLGSSADELEDALTLEAEDITSKFIRGTALNLTNLRVAPDLS